MSQAEPPSSVCIGKCIHEPKMCKWSPPFREHTAAKKHSAFIRHVLTNVPYSQTSSISMLTLAFSSRLPAQLWKAVASQHMKYNRGKYGCIHAHGPSQASFACYHGWHAFPGRRLTLWVQEYSPQLQSTQKCTAQLNIFKEFNFRTLGSPSRLKQPTA